MLKNLINQPLLHFLLIGLGLFLLYDLTGKENPEELVSKTVLVDKNALLTFMQYRSKSFDRKQFEDRLKNMPQEKLNRLIDDYVREEVLYREALRLGFDKNDYVLRRRLVQKLEFVNQGFIDSTMTLTDTDIEDYFKENKERYYVEPYITFTHVFFNNEIHGKDKAAVISKNELKVLNGKDVPFTDSMKYGDRFLYHTNYVERAPEYVSSHFGRDMAKSVFGLEPSDKIWYGPFESPYGYHLVKLSNREDGRYPEIGEIYGKVKQDAQIDLSKEKSEKTIRDIIDNYDVRMVYKRPVNKSPSPKTTDASRNIEQKKK